MNERCGVSQPFVTPQAPFTPFLTEKMYQHLRLLLTTPPSDDTASIHYIMCPKTK